MSDGNSRDQLIKLMSDQAAKEEQAVRDYATFLQSSAAKTFLEKIQSLQQNTVPGSSFDQLFQTFGTLIQNTLKLSQDFIVQADNNAKVQAEAKAQREAAEEAAKPKVEADELPPKPVETSE